MTTADQVRSLIAEHLGIDAARLTDDARFRDRLLRAPRHARPSCCTPLRLRPVSRCSQRDTRDRTPAPRQVTHRQRQQATLKLPLQRRISVEISDLAGHHCVNVWGSLTRIESRSATGTSVNVICHRSAPTACISIRLKLRQLGWMCVRPTPLTHGCVEGGRSGFTVGDAR